MFQSFCIPCTRNYAVQHRTTPSDRSCRRKIRCGPHRRSHSLADPCPSQPPDRFRTLHASSVWARARSWLPETNSCHFVRSASGSPLASSYTYFAASSRHRTSPSTNDKTSLSSSSKCHFQGRCAGKRRRFYHQNASLDGYLLRQYIESSFQSDKSRSTSRRSAE